MAGILVHDISKSYQLDNGQKKVVLQDVNLEIKDGEFVCLLGPSGCGKTTLLNILSGLDLAYQGTVHLTHTGSDDQIGVKNQLVMSYMFQESRLLPWLSVKENIRFVLDGYHSKEDTDRIDRWLTRVGLAGYGDYYPMQLSTGMQQRVSVARALIRNPELLFMDEPFSALDALTALQMRRELLELWADQSCTVVFVTHNPLEAVHLADHIVIMSPSPGHIVDKVRLDGLLPRPRDPDDPKLWELSRRITRQLIGADHEPTTRVHH